MNDSIKELIWKVIGDVEDIRNSDMEAKDRLPVEIMALNAVSNAYEKIK